MKQNKKLRIFIVEDNLLFQQLIAKELESISCSLHSFTNGEDCIDHLQYSIPDVLVLDNNLEGEISGLETLKLIRVLHADLYIVLFSTQEALNTKENLAYYGNFDFVEKTITSFTELRQKICNSRIYHQKLIS